MNIAVVDDKFSESAAAESYLREFIQKNYPELEPEIKIATFSSAKDFLNVFKPGLFQLIILDIMMPETDGLRTAQIIRARGDDDANIVFLTNNDDFILKAYRVFAVGYFIKPIYNHSDDFRRTFEHIFPKIFRKTPEITLNVSGAEISVPFRKIFYIETDYRHRLCVYLTDDERFVESYHRIIINMDYIRHMDEDDFIMPDGTSLSISQRKKKDVKVKFMRYLAHK